MAQRFQEPPAMAQRFQEPPAMAQRFQEPPAMAQRFQEPPAMAQRFQEPPAMVQRFQEHMQGKIMSPDEDLPPMPKSPQNNNVQNNARFIQQQQQPAKPAAPLLEHAYNARFNMQRDPTMVNTGEGTSVAEAMWSRNTQFNQKPAMPGYVS
jgi:hypothetical protein